MAGSHLTKIPGTQIVDMSGKRVGRWTVLRLSRMSSHEAMWWCRCVCGTEREVRGPGLRSGHSQSCGCGFTGLVVVPLRRHHGLTGSKAYVSYSAMMNRCLNPNDRDFQNYGGRGITVCRRWRDSVEVFARDVGMPPTPKHTLDRIDVNGHYEPQNVRWATRKEQARNRRTNRMVTMNGKTMCVSAWREALGHG